MKVIVRMRAGRHSGKPRCMRAGKAMQRFETNLRTRAEALLGATAASLSFEQIFAALAPLRSKEARDLRKTIANYFELA